MRYGSVSVDNCVRSSESIEVFGSTWKVVRAPLEEAQSEIARRSGNGGDICSKWPALVLRSNDQARPAQVGGRQTLGGGIAAASRGLLQT